MIDTQTLRAVVDAALDWIVDHRHEFDPGDERNGYRPNRAKPLVELALMVRYHVDVTGSDAAVEPLLELIRDVQARPAYRDRLRTSRVDLLQDAHLCGVVHDPEVHAHVRRLVDRGLLDHVERKPYQVMEERLALDLIGLDGAPDDWQELVDRSLAGHLPGPSFLGPGGTYQLTHDILHVLAFGLRPDPAAQLPDSVRDPAVLSALTLTFTEDRHWDLVAELLLCWDCLELPATPVYDRAWDALLNMQADDGSFAGVEDGCSPPDRWPEASEDRRRFLDRYHTTLVVIIACLCRLHGAGQGRRRRPRATRPAPIAGSLLRDVAGREADWLARQLHTPGRDPTRPAVACGVLVGTWICGALSEDVAATVPHVAQQASDRLEGLESWPSMPPTLSILTAALLAVHARVPDPLAAFVRAAADTLAAHDVADPAQDLELNEKRVLLHHLGLLEAPARLDFAVAVAAAHRACGDLTAANEDALLLAVASATAQGTEPVTLTPETSWIGDFVLGLAAHRCRAYDLLTAGRLLRAAAQLGVQGRSDVTGFLLCQQRPGGGFGLTGGVSHTDGEPNLGPSLACLWALAEAATAWRLCSGVRDVAAAF